MDHLTIYKKYLLQVNTQNTVSFNVAFESGNQYCNFNLEDKSQYLEDLGKITVPSLDQPPLFPDLIHIAHRLSGEITR